MIELTINSISLRFETGDNVFSPSAVDRGTLAMLSKVTFSEDDYVLDLGCGYGPVGIYAARLIGQDRVVMTDISQEALLLSKTNAELNGVGGIPFIESDGFQSIPQTGFTRILSNPPYHTDFSVAKGFIEEGYKRLVPGGRMYMVTKRREWYKNKLISVFGGVLVTEEDGYFVFCAEKREKQISPQTPDRSGDVKTNAKTLSKKLMRREKTRQQHRKGKR